MSVVSVAHFRTRITFIAGCSECSKLVRAGAAKLQGISQKSCGVLKKLGTQIQWLESYVTDDKLYCANEPWSTNPRIGRWRNIEKG
jgi:hypothetical protein